MTNPAHFLEFPVKHTGKEQSSGAFSTAQKHYGEESSLTPIS